MCEARTLFICTNLHASFAAGELTLNHPLSQFSHTHAHSPPCSLCQQLVAIVECKKNNYNNNN